MNRWGDTEKNYAQEHTFHDFLKQQSHDDDDDLIPNPRKK